MEGRPRGIVAIAGLDVIYYGGQIAEVVRLAYGRVERSAGVPSAVIVAVVSGPAPVDVYHVVEGVETVDNECVSHRHILAAIEHWPAGADLVLHDLVELGLRASLRTLPERYSGVIAEVVHESDGHFNLVSARAGISELRADTCGGVIEKRADSLGLGRRATGLVVVEHIVPVVSHVEVNTVVAAGAAFGELVVLHYNRHCGAHTAGKGIAGNLTVERRFLAPGGSLQIDRLSGGVAAYHFPAHVACHWFLQVGRGLYLGFETVHHPLHGRRKRRGIVRTFERISQNRRGAVVGRHDDVGLAVASVKHVIKRIFRRHPGVNQL